MTVKLNDRALASALRVLGQAKTSGLLTIVGPKGLASIVLIDGRILYARIDTTPSLEQALIEQGVLATDVCEAVRSLVKRKKVQQPFGRVLLELGLVTEELVEAKIDEQVRSVVGELLAWEQGTFHFDAIRLRESQIEFPECLQSGIPADELLT